MRASHYAATSMQCCNSLSRSAAQQACSSAGSRKTSAPSGGGWCATSEVAAAPPLAWLFDLDVRFLDELREFRDVVPHQRREFIRCARGRDWRTMSVLQESGPRERPHRRRNLP